MSNEDSQSSPEPENTSTSQNKAFRAGAILKIVGPITLLMAGGVVFFGLFDGAKWFSNLTKPRRVPVVGRVIYNGEALPDAVIETRPVDTDLAGSYGTGDDQGGFKLVTQINGDFLDGAYVGEHVVTVKRYDMNVMTLGTPPLLTPGIYASFDTSPLRIAVKAGESEFVLELNGEPEAIAVEPGSQRQMRPPGSDAPDEDRERGRNRGGNDDTSSEVETEQNSTRGAENEAATSDESGEAR